MSMKFRFRLRNNSRKRIFVLVATFFAGVLLVLPGQGSAFYPVPDDLDIELCKDFSPNFDPVWRPINTSLPYGDIICPEAEWGLISTENDNDPYPAESENIKEWTWTTYLGDINPGDFNDNKLVFAVTNDFTASYRQAQPPTEEVNVSFVIVIIHIIASEEYDDFWLSIRHNETDDLVEGEFQNCTPFLASPQLYPYTIGVQYETNGWYSSDIIDGSEIYYYEDSSWTWVWNVTSLYDWNVTMLTSDDIFVMFSGLQKYHRLPVEIDYLGIGWGYGSELMPTGLGDQEIPSVDFEKNVTSLIWLMIIFTPAIAIAQVIPKLGFIIGITISVLIFGFTVDGFFPVTIITLLGVSVVLYKGN